MVEDEPGLRFVISDCLAHEGGFDVIEAASADEALKILDSTAGIRCVFTDVRMPGTLDGIALTREVQTRFPEVAVMMTSGNLLPNERIANVPFVTKPYDLHKVSEAITALIAQLGPKTK